jgi:hypothetical protein
VGNRRSRQLREGRSLLRRGRDGEGQRRPVDLDPVSRVAAKDFPEDILRFVTVSRRSHNCASFLRVPQEDLTLYVKNSMPLSGRKQTSLPKSRQCRHVITHLFSSGYAGLGSYSCHHDDNF